MANQVNIKWYLLECSEPFTFEESKPFNAGHVNDIISPNSSIFS